MIEFIPPKENVVIPQFATYVERRWDKSFKVHSRLSDARQSLSYSGQRRVQPGEPGWRVENRYYQPRVWKDCYLLQNVDGVWIVREHHKDGDAIEYSRTRNTAKAVADAFADGVRSGLALAAERSAKATDS